MNANRKKDRKRIKHRLFTLSLSLCLAFGLCAAPAFAEDSAVHSSPFAKLLAHITGSNKVVVKDVDYDRGDREVEFEFKNKVKWKNPTVKITRGGKNYAKKILHKDSDELEVKVKKLTYGAIYSYKITGVKNKNGTKFVTVTGSFRAIDD